MDGTPSGAPESRGSAGPAQTFWALSDDLLCVGDEAGFTELNPAWERALGWTREELLAMRPGELLHPDDVSRAPDGCAPDGGSRTAHAECRVRCADGSFRWFSWSRAGDASTWTAAGRPVARDGAAHGGDRGTAEDAEMLLATLDALPDPVAVLGAQGEVLRVNAAWTSSGAANGAGAGVGANFVDVCDRAGAAGGPEGDVAARVAGALREVLSGRRDAVAVEFGVERPEHRDVELRAIRVAGGGAAHVVLQHRSMTAHRAAEQAAHSRGRLLDEVDAAVIALDPDGRVTEWNRGAERMLGWSSEEALGRLTTDLGLTSADRAPASRAMDELRANGHWQGEFELRRKDGGRFPAQVRNAVIRDAGGALIGYVGVSVDISEQRRAERELRSARDHLQAVADSMGDGLCTLDHAGRILYVNPRGEELLGWTSAELAGRELHHVLHRPGPDGSPLPPGDCPQVCPGPDPPAGATGGRRAVRSEDDVLVRRDGTLLPVQQVLTPLEDERGGGYVLVFSDISERQQRLQAAERRLEDLVWVELIRDALREDRLVLYAQPIIEVASGRVVQHELLIRMRDGTDTLVPPAAFLPIAERWGLISEIDRWVVGQAVGLAAEGHAVELNVSADSLSDPGFYDYVDRALTRSGADPGLLVFELTETALLSDEVSAIRFATAIAERGCGLALDDFGTGYGGFSYLKRLAVDYLKIDIEFVRDLASAPASRKVVEAVVTLARSFGLKTVAEGVEDRATLQLLDRYGVDLAQGYAIGRPGALHDTIHAEAAGTT